MVNRLLIVLISTCTVAFGALSAGDLYVNSLHDIFQSATVQHINGDNLSVSRTCPNNKKIVYGHYAHFASLVTTACTSTNSVNGVCNVGAQSCSIAECSTPEKDLNLVSTVCSDNIIPGSKTKSLVTTTVSSVSLSCDAGQRILFGFSMQYNRGQYDEDCAIANSVACPIGAQTCSMSSCGGQDDPLKTIRLLCVPTEQANYLASRMKIVDFRAGNAHVDFTTSCPSAFPVQMFGFGFAYQIGGNIGGTAGTQLKASTIACGYKETCSQKAIDTVGDDELFQVLLCAQPYQNEPVTDPPTESPSETPSRTPIKSPTKSPIKSPTKSPSVTETRPPTVTGDTPFPTESPTKSPLSAGETKSPTVTDDVVEEASGSIGTVFGVIGTIAFSVAVVAGFKYRQKKNSSRTNNPGDSDGNPALPGYVRAVYQFPRLSENFFKRKNEDFSLDEITDRKLFKSSKNSDSFLMPDPANNKAFDLLENPSDIPSFYKPPKARKELHSVSHIDV